MSKDSYFEQVLSGTVEVEKVLETENMLAFHHAEPHWPTHIVVLPKQQIPSLTTLKDNDLILEMMKVVKVVATLVNEKHGAARVLMQMGAYEQANRLYWHVCQGEAVK